MYTPDGCQVMTGEIGDGWEGVKGLAMALSAHASPRNSPRDNSNNNGDTGASGGDRVTSTINNIIINNNNNNGETPLIRLDNNGTAGTTIAGGSVVISGNRARSMFAQRLKASTAPTPAPISKDQQQAES